MKIDRLTRQEAMNVALYLAAMVGKVCSRRMDAKTRAHWQKDLQRNRTSSLDAPT